ncbi:hypothetical protein SAMN05216326_10744 [Nitrosomonas marina]|uniref:Uncharacterized protein n=1 Tax=Nitrosomonas marina TaxID=917 RepID=A0A1I0AGR9_9PROT|nr:hypothetical protein SAMN05216326_10744 [Nitrosomonas marina]
MLKAVILRVLFELSHVAIVMELHQAALRLLVALQIPGLRFVSYQV